MPALTCARTVALAAAVVAMSGAALACPNVDRRSKVANSDVVVKGVVDCPVGSTSCSLTTKRILKAEPRALREILRRDDVRIIVGPLADDPAEIYCTLYWQAYAGRYKGTFYFGHRGDNVFFAAYWPEATREEP